MKTENHQAFDVVIDKIKNTIIGFKLKKNIWSDLERKV